MEPWTATSIFKCRKLLGVFLFVTVTCTFLAILKKDNLIASLRIYFHVFRINLQQKNKIKTNDAHEFRLAMVKIINLRIPLGFDCFSLTVDYFNLI